MALQTSGKISLLDIQAETGDATASLISMSEDAGKTAPHGIKEFYGYSAAPVTNTLSVSPATATVTNLGGTVTISVSSNTSWSASLVNYSTTGWTATLSATSGTNNGSITCTIPGSGRDGVERGVSVKVTTTSGSPTISDYCDITQTAASGGGFP
jgi:hypothetical protein